MYRRGERRAFRRPWQQTGKQQKEMVIHVMQMVHVVAVTVADAPALVAGFAVLTGLLGLLRRPAPVPVPVPARRRGRQAR